MTWHLDWIVCFILDTFNLPLFQGCGIGQIFESGDDTEDFSDGKFTQKKYRIHEIFTRFIGKLLDFTGFHPYFAVN
jgi:hypothetical protein